jgi:hypothetical protein
MQVFSFVAKLCKFGQYDAANEHVSRSKHISQVVVSLFKDASPLLHHVELLEDSVNAVVPLNLSFTKVAIGVMKVSKLVERLDLKEVLLALS